MVPMPPNTLAAEQGRESLAFRNLALVHQFIGAFWLPYEEFSSLVVDTRVSTYDLGNGKKKG